MCFCLFLMLSVLSLVLLYTTIILSLSRRCWNLLTAPYYDKNQAESCTENEADAPWPSNGPLVPSISIKSMNDLCSQCAALDILPLFNGRYLYSNSHGSGSALLSVDLGHSAAGIRASRCALCRLFGAVANSHSEQKYDSYRVYYHSERYLFIGWSKNLSQCKTILLSVQNNDWGTSSGPYIGLATPTTINQNPDMFGLRFLNAESFDCTIAEGWLRSCRLRHTAICRPATPLKMRSFRVIDCLSTKVVKAAKNCEYVALSYVWGKPLSSGPGGDLAFQNFESAPKVILDSIELVKRLGLQYLWVDRYCINQANAQEKHDQICQMDMIYASAQFTIIAAASGDPNYGLPGVNGTSRNPQPAIKIGEQIIISTLDSPDTLLSRSEWATRGWTYQEGVLSKRRLIFTRQQVFFECNSMHCVETVNLPLNAMREDAPQDFDSPFSTAGAFKTKAIGIPSSFMSCIREFTMRKLSYETDALNAMSGVFSVFEKVHPAVFQLKGVPFMTRIAPGSPQTFTADFEFVIGLLWWHPDARQCCRRSIFPSWSWAGWAGPTGGSFRFNESAQMKCGVKMSVELPNKRLKPFPQQRKHIPPFLAKARDAKFIHFTAKTSACKIIKKAASLGLEHQLLYAALLVGDVSINIELSFFPDELILSEQGSASCLFREGLTAMILAYNSFESTPYYMSIIVAKQSRCGEYMERVGVCYALVSGIARVHGGNVSMVRDFGNPKKSGGYSREIKDWLARRPVQTIRLG